MDFKLNREEITTSEVIFDGSQEQAIELDYVLPDYYPEIFKIVKCITTPKIVSYCVNGDKLTYELTVCMRIMYCSEQSSSLQVIDQKLNYTKTVELGKPAAKPKVSIIAKTDYINCRAINQRRVDVRGAISARVKVTDICKKEVVSDAYGMNIQLRKKPVTYPTHKLYASKRTTVTDDFDLGMSKPSIISILRNDATIISTDKKIIANKMVAKGEILINMLYTCIKDNNPGIETMQFSLPFSQIIDIDGIDERFDCMIDCEVISCDMLPKSDGDGETKMVDCSVMLLINVSAQMLSTVDIAVDQFSTQYETECEASDIKVELVPTYIDCSQVIKGTIDYSDGELDCIYDVWCNINNYSTKINLADSQVVVSGNAQYTVFAKNNEGLPVVIEKEDAFDFSVNCEKLTDNSVADIKITPVACSYNLTSSNTVEAKAELKVIGIVNNNIYMNALTDITVNENASVTRDGDYALRLYFAEANEDLWEIAKKYGTSVDAIMEENNLSDEIIADYGMILIPIV